MELPRCTSPRVKLVGLGAESGKEMSSYTSLRTVVLPMPQCLFSQIVIFSVC